MPLNLEALESAISMRKARIAGYKEQEEEMEKKLEAALASKAELDGAVAVLESCIKQRLQAISGVTNVARTLLKNVHGPQFDFAIEEVEEDGCVRGIRILCSEFGNTMPPSKLGRGGEAIVHIAIRLAMLLLNPDSRKVFILDEPAPTVDSERWESFMDTLSSVVRKAGGQLIYITHTGHAEPVTYYVSKPANAATVKREDLAWRTASTSNANKAKRKEERANREGGQSKRKKRRA